MKKQTNLIRRYIGDNLVTMWQTQGVNFSVAGGACTSVFSGMPINDADVFFVTTDDFTLASRLLGSGYGYQLKFQTDVADSYQNEVTGHKLQLIQKIFGEPVDIIRQFDFTVCQCAWSGRHEKFVMVDQFLQHLAERHLAFNIEAKYPIASLYRAMKYVKKGYQFTGIEAIKLALCIHNLTIKSYQDLKEQLEGIDTLILKDLTDKLIEKKDLDYDWQSFLAEMNDYLEKVFTDF